MAKKTEKSQHLPFRRAFRGYKKKEVEEYLLRLGQERAIAEQNYQERICLLVQESEHASQMISSLQADKELLLSDHEQYKKQLSEQGKTINVLYERLDLLGNETERLQNALNEATHANTGDHITAEEWKQRALTAEETVRRMAEAEMQADRERDSEHRVRVPLGKKAYLDLTLHKDDKSV